MYDYRKDKWIEGDGKLHAIPEFLCAMFWKAIWASNKAIPLIKDKLTF